MICDDQDLVLPIQIPTDGTYELELQFLGDVTRKSADLTAGDNATFDKAGLNERFTYVASVRDPGGETVPFTLDGKTYDCVEFTTQRQTA